MLASLNLKCFVALTLAWASISFASSPIESSAELVKRASPHGIGRRSVDVGSAVRFHRRRRRSTELPAPAGTTRAKGMTQADNIALLAKFQAELVSMNEEWQHAANEALASGHRVLNYDEYKAKKNGETYDEEDCKDELNSTVSLIGDVGKETETNKVPTKEVPKKKVMPPKQESEPEREQGHQEKQSEEKLPHPKPKIILKKPKPQSKPSPQPEPQPQPEPNPQPKAQPKTQPEPEEKSTESDGGNSGHGEKRQKGDMTYYDPGLDACGFVDTESDAIVAVSPKWFQQFGGELTNGNPICGKEITIYKKGKSKKARIVDICPVCTEGSLDMSPSLFEYFENKDVGRCDVEWEFAKQERSVQQYQ